MHLFYKIGTILFVFLGEHDKKKFKMYRKFCSGKNIRVKFRNWIISSVNLIYCSFSNFFVSLNNIMQNHELPRSIYYFFYTQCVLWSKFKT